MKKALRLLVGLLCTFVASHGAFAACTNTVTVKDGAGVSQTFCRGTDGTNMISSVNILDSAGTNFAAVTAGNALKVDASATTQPVSGTVTANAGTNLNTSALALDTSVNGLLLGQASTTSGQKGPLAQGAVTTAKPSYTTAQTDPLSLDTSGLLRVSLADTPANTNSFLVTATQSGNWTTRIVGNTGAILDFAGQNAAQPANSQLMGCAFNTTPTTVASGNATQLQCTSAARLIVDGSQVTQPVSGTVAATQSGNWTTRIVGNAGATLDAAVGAAAAPANGEVVLGVFNTTAPAPTNGQSAALQLSSLSNLLVEQGCAGQSVANTSVKPFSLASTTALKIISLVSGKKVYICSINIVSAAANNVALIEGTKTTNDCDTTTAGLAGGTTAATGWNFAANGGLTLGNGQGLVAKSGTASLDVCLLASATGQLSGTVVYAQY